MNRTQCIDSISPCIYVNMNVNNMFEHLALHILQICTYLLHAHTFHVKEFITKKIQRKTFFGEVVKLTKFYIFAEVNLSPSLTSYAQSFEITYVFSH